MPRLLHHGRDCGLPGRGGVRLCGTLALGWLLSGAVVIDRIAAIVGNHAIKLSDVDRDLRLTDFLNRTPLSFSPQARGEATERLIDQQIIRNEIATGGYTRASDADAEALLKQIRAERFGRSDANLRAELRRYGLTEDELRQQLLWQLTVLRFISQKFQPAVSVPDADVRTYYDQHLAQLKRQHPQDYSFQTLQAGVRSVVEGEKVDQNFDQWLKQARLRNRVEYRTGEK